MELSKVLILLFFTIITSGYTEEIKTPLKPIISKQALYNIRFVSQDASFTIYQKHTGSLFLSTNYSIKKIIDSDENTQFTVEGVKSSKYLLISKKDGAHREFNPNNNEEIYLYPYSLNGKAELIGTGINPQSHLNGDFVSYINKSNRKIYLQKLTLPKSVYTFSLPDSPNPFFSESVLMPNENTILISWQNASGINEIIKMNLEQSESKIIKKLNSYYSKLEMCLKNENLYFFEASYIGYNQEGSKITTIDLNNFNETTLYSSKATDLGQISCHIEENSIYFIKNFSENKKDYFDVAKLTLPSNKIQRMTNEDYVTNIFEMDGRLIAVNNGEQMLLFGENSLKKDSIPSGK